MKIIDALERLLWTFIAAALGSLSGAALFGVAVWKAAALAGLTAVANAVLIFARWRLSVLPNPGNGLPGAEILTVRGNTHIDVAERLRGVLRDRGAVDVLTVLWVIFLLLAIVVLLRELGIP